MKPWIKLSVVFAAIIALGAFVICGLPAVGAFATDSSIVAQSNRAEPSKAPSRQPAATPSPSKQLPPPTPPRYGHPPVAPKPTDKPLPRHRVPVVPPPGMTICVFTNSAGELIAIIVPVGSTCINNADGSVTVTFPDGTTFIIPSYASEGVFYTSDYDPVIIVPYYNSTVTLTPDFGYSITLPDGRVYLLPIHTRGENPFFWLFPPRPLPIPNHTPVVPPNNTTSYVFTNSNGDQIIIIAPAGSTFHLNDDGSVTIILPDGPSYTVPFTATNYSITTQQGYHIIVVPYLGTTIVQYGDMGYLITLPDGSTRWDDRIYFQFEHPPIPPNVPPGLWYSIYTFLLHIPGAPPFDTFAVVVGVPGIGVVLGDDGHIWITFPDGFSTWAPSMEAGAYSAQRWVQTPAPPHWVTYHWAIVPEGSTVTSLGNGWYHVEPPAGSGVQPFDFQSP